MLGVVEQLMLSLMKVLQKEAVPQHVMLLQPMASPWVVHDELVSRGIHEVIESISVNK